MNERIAELSRATSETAVSIFLNLDRPEPTKIDTGLPFLDHMLEALAKHAGIALVLECRGDLRVDDHHTVEDCALALGEALDRALGDKRGITRFGAAYAPLDEALVRAVIDLSGRPGGYVQLPFAGFKIGEVATENLSHFFRSFAAAARLTLHLDLLRGENDHHRAESAFKALALALRAAVARSGRDLIPSTKGML